MTLFPRGTRLHFFTSCPQLPVLDAKSHVNVVELEDPFFCPDSTHGRKALSWAKYAENNGALNTLFSAPEAVVPLEEREAKRI